MRQFICRSRRTLRFCGQFSLYRSGIGRQYTCAITRYEPAEIAELMGCKATQVSTYLYRGKAKLRTMLGGIYGEECLSK